MSAYPKRLNIIKHLEQLRTLSNSEYDAINYFARVAHALDLCVIKLNFVISSCKGFKSSKVI